MRLAILLLLPFALEAQPAWPQFGGPNRDFTAPAAAVAGKWPATGPKLLWSQPLGEGYSTISTDGKLLYTMTRQSPSRETVIALGCAT